MNAADGNENEPISRPITLQGAEGIRALAHPARALAIEKLLEGPPTTATHLSKLAHVTPSAMSYHLRELAKQGIVRRVDSPHDGRERLWEATGNSLTVIPDVGSTLPRVAVQTVVSRHVEKLTHALSEHERARALQGEGTMQYGTLWLTPAEEEQLASTISSALQEFGIYQRTPDLHPEGAQRFEMWSFLIPSDPENDV